MRSASATAAILLLTAGSLAGCASGDEPRPAPDALVERLNAMRPVLERLRGHRVDPMPRLCLGASDYYREITAANADPDLVRAWSRLYSAIGLLPPNADLLALLAEHGDQRPVAHYDPRSKTIFLRDVDVTDSTLLHELAHALKDQRFGQRTTDADDPPDRADTLAALDSLTEGEATVLALARDHPGLTYAQLAERVDTNPPTDLGGAPRSLVRRWTAPYREGAAFVAAVVAQHGWEGVDRLFADRPLSTEQILHPEKALGPQLDLPVRLELPDQSQHIGGSLLTTDTIGELGLRVMFEELSGDSQVDACAGWDGDLVQAYDVDGATAIVWLLTFDSEADAQVFAATVERHKASGPVPLRSATVRREGADVILVGGARDPSTTAQAALDGAQGR